MNIASLYQKIKQILNDSNIALINKGFSGVNSLYDVFDEIAKHGEINRFPYLYIHPYYYFGEGVDVTAEDLENITEIRDYMFNNCQGIKKVTIPEGVTSIGNHAFYDCTSLSNIYLHSTTPPTLSSANAIPSKTTIHVPIGSGDTYKAATNWSSFASNIVDDIEV